MQMLLLQSLQALGLIHEQFPILFLPAVVRLLGDSELLTSVKHRLPIAGFPSRLSADIE